MIRLLCYVVMLGLATACSHQPTSVKPSPITASWVDQFDRPDGPLGDGWDMRGRREGGYSLPPSSGGFIHDGYFTYAGDSIVYAVRKFSSPVTRIGTMGRWARSSSASTETVMAMAITPNDKIIADMVHFVATRFGWELSLRRDNGPFNYLVKRPFDPPLSLDRDYVFEMTVAGDSIEVRVPGGGQTVAASTSGLVGNRAFWEEFAKPEELPAGVVFNFDTVWIAEAGQPLFPLAGVSSE